ncbi:MAG: LPS export ABC transporter periplasmic protein LptC [Pseudomonadota bacterium]|nr:LPS export ABC transporter periplasmic protein LptC [Pseudomonadota bacterium]
MKPVANAWLPLGILLLLAGLTFWLMRIVEVKQPQPDKKRHDPDMIVENFTARQLGLDGGERYTITARKMLHFPDDDSTLLDGVQFSAKEKNDAPLQVTSERAKLTGKADEIFFLDRVQIVRDPFQGYQRLVGDTTYFHVIPDLGIGKTDQPISLREGDNVMTAEGMEINNKTRIAILSTVKASYHAPKR